MQLSTKSTLYLPVLCCRDKRMLDRAQELYPFHSVSDTFNMIKCRLLNDCCNYTGSRDIDVIDE